jgi:hypothetical protein
MSALVIAQATTDQGTDTRTLLRLIHDLTEILDESTPAELWQEGDPTPKQPKPPEPTPGNPRPAVDPVTPPADPRTRKP